MKLDIDSVHKMGIISEVRIRFNGLELKNCVFTDEETGVALVYDYEMWETYKKLGIVYNGIEIPKKIMKGDVWIMFGDRK